MAAIVEARDEFVKESAVAQRRSDQRPQSASGSTGGGFHRRHGAFLLEELQREAGGGYRLNPKDEKLKGSLKLKTERSSLEHYAPKTYLRMSTS